MPEAPRTASRVAGPAPSRAAALGFLLLLAAAFANPAVPDGQSPPPPESALPVMPASLTVSQNEVGATADLYIEPPPGLDLTRVTFSFPPGVVPAFVETDPAARADDGRWHFPVRLLIAGAHEIETLDVAGRTPEGTTLRWRTAPLRFDIPPPDAAPADPRNYTAVFRAPVNWWRIGLLVTAATLVLALLAILAVWLHRRRRRRHAAILATPAPPMPPLEEALAGLARLQTLELYRSHGSKAHYAEWSTLVRRYFERALGVCALEWTEEETAGHIERRMPSRAAAQRLVPAFANAALAKFARWDASEATLRADLAVLQTFLHDEAERLRIEQAQSAGRRNANDEAA